MKLKINKSQLSLLSNNFVIIEGQGLQYQDKHIINESIKEFKVKVFFGGWPTTIRVGANSSASALSIVRLMFPQARVTANITAV